MAGVQHLADVWKVLSVAAVACLRWAKIQGEEDYLAHNVRGFSRQSLSLTEDRGSSLVARMVTVMGKGRIIPLDY